MFKKFALTAALFFACIGIASATEFGAGIGASIDVSGYTGTGGGYASSATVGGSMAQGNVNGTGLSTQFTSNQGGGYAGAGSTIGRDSVVTYTTGGSTSQNVSVGYTTGQAGGTASGGVGTDYSSNAWGSVNTAGYGASIGASVGFGTFGNF